MLLPLKRMYWSSRERLREVIKSSFTDTIRVCKVRGHRISVCCSNAIEAFRAGTYETKEPETLDWLDANMKPGIVFYDVGANIGLYSLYAATIQPAVKVLAFEPEATNFSRLMKNIAINGLFDRITPYNVAISNATNLGFLHLSDLNAGSALHSFGVGKALLKEGIFSTSLDDLVQVHGLPAPCVIKIDVDGIEEKIFNGARSVLENKSLRSILTEINFDDPTNLNIDRLLTAKGFHLENKITSEPPSTIFNCIYTRT